MATAMLAILLAQPADARASTPPLHSCSGGFGLNCLHPNLGKALQAINGQECYNNLNCKICTTWVKDQFGNNRWDCGPFQEGYFQQHYQKGLSAGCLGSATLNGQALAQSFGVVPNPPTPKGTVWFNEYSAYTTQTIPGPNEYIIAAVGRLCAGGLVDDIVNTPNICDKGSSQTQKLLNDMVQLWNPGDHSEWVKGVSYYLCNSVGQGLNYIGGMISDMIAAANGYIPVSSYLPGMTACWLCPLFEVVFDTSVEYANAMFVILAPALRNILALALAVWLLLEAIKLLLPFGPADESKKLGNAVVARLGLTLLVLTSLSQMSVVWDYGYTPIMSFLLDYGSGIQNQVQDSILKKQPAAMLGNSVDDCPTTVSGQRQIQGLTGSVKDNPTVVSKAISCQMANMQKALGVVPMLGFQAFKSSATVFTGDTRATFGVIADFVVLSKNQMWYMLVNMDVIIGAVLVILAFGLLLILLPIYMIDAVIQLAIVFMVSPFLVASAIYPKTRKAFDKGVRTVAQSLMTLLVLGVVIAFVLAMMNSMLNNVVKAVPGFDKVSNVFDATELIKLVDTTEGSKAIQDLIRITKPYF
ncbi:MAG: type IV secretion system protein, partial [Alphaproteobacteria bacterium]|nr:type IV secretion system protein [Alphaproteobacteria bacterium]